MGELYFNGVAMPTPALNGLSFKIEKIWSKQTGRAANGAMLGDVIAIKTTLQIKWPPLTGSQTALIDSYISQPFFTVTFTDPRINAIRTITVYAGTPIYPVYSYYRGVKTYHGVAVDLIEQ